MTSLRSSRSLRSDRRNALTTLRALLYLVCFSLAIACGLLCIICLAIALHDKGRRVGIAIRASAPKRPQPIVDHDVAIGLDSEPCSRVANPFRGCRSSVPLAML